MEDNRTKQLKMLFALTLAGALFSGYLSATKLFTGVCALNESCPYFLGYPACFYGFGMFLLMFLGTFFGVIKKIAAAVALKINVVVSILGVVFYGNFAIRELLEHRVTGAIGLSTCVYGFIFYAFIFVISFSSLRRAKR